MSALEHIGRYLGFAALLGGYFYLFGTLAALQQKEYLLQPRRLVLYLVAFAQSVLLWDGVVVIISPITGVLNLRLLLGLLWIPVVSTALGWLVGRALKVKPDGKTSAATAALLVSVRHGWLGRLTATTTLMVPALLIAGLVAVFLDVSDRETLMLRLAFGIVFLASVPMTILAALIMMSPIPDDNSRDGQLAGGITWVIVQVIAVALLLSSVDLPRTHIPVGVFDASLTVSFPVLAIVLGYFVLGTAIPYLVGGKRAKVFRAQLVEEEERIKDHLYKLLLIPRAKTYAPMLTQLRNTVEARISELKDEYFYLNPLTPPKRR